MAFQNVRRGSGDVCRTFLKWDSCIHSSLSSPSLLLPLSLLLLGSVCLSRGGRGAFLLLSMAENTLRLQFWRRGKLDKFLQSFDDFVTLKITFFQAEIVRKKGKSLLNDPLFNKVGFHLENWPMPVRTIPKSFPSTPQKIMNCNFQGLAYPESERDRLAIRGVFVKKKNL